MANVAYQELQTTSGENENVKITAQEEEEQRLMREMFENEVREQLSEYAFGQVSPSIYSAALGCLLWAFNPNNTIGKWKKVPGIAATFFQLFFNIFLQIFLLVCIKVYISAPAVRSVRRIYQDYHNKVFIDGVFNQEKWDNWNSFNRESLCQLPLSEPYFFSSLLLIWTFYVVKELQETRIIFNRMSDLPESEDPHNWITVSRGNPYLVDAMSVWMKRIIMTTIYLPKFVIAITLWLLGARWLTATQSFEDLILNAVALGFILELDELIHDAMLSDTQKVDLSRWKLKQELPEDEDGDGLADVSARFYRITSGTSTNIAII
eukprot:GEMP01046391.1.p1 GENE.GEMP01046391.1~~GEMP01046391.1.p1  ORF type:complete len:321 (+),score=43.28 GEMP01046391.1:172-1134(+)